MVAGLDPERKEIDAGSTIRSLVGMTVREVERELILETLKERQGNRTHAADALGVSVRGLRDKLNSYAEQGLEVPPPAASSSSRYQQ